MTYSYQVPSFLLLDAKFTSSGLEGDLLPIDLFSRVDIQILNEPKIKLTNRSEFKSHTNDLNPIYFLIKDFRKMYPSRKGVHLHYQLACNPSSGLLTDWAIAIAMILLLNEKWQFNLSDEKIKTFLFNYPPFCLSIYQWFKNNKKPSGAFVQLFQLPAIFIDEDWLKMRAKENLEEVILNHFPDLKRVHVQLKIVVKNKVGFCGKGPMLYALLSEKSSPIIPMNDLAYFYSVKACQPIIELID